jgi:uncharacterized protein
MIRTVRSRHDRSVLQSRRWITSLLLRERTLNRFILFILVAALFADTSAASFDCAKASTQIEKSICADPEISEFDSQLMQVYKASLANSLEHGPIKLEQRAWLSTVRNRCQDAMCLKQAYIDRIAALDGARAGANLAHAIPLSNATDRSKMDEKGASVSPSATDIVLSPVQPITQPSQEKAEPNTQAVAPTTASTKGADTTAASSPEWVFRSIVTSDSGLS